MAGTTESKPIERNVTVTVKSTEEETYNTANASETNSIHQNTTLQMAGSNHTTNESLTSKMAKRISIWVRAGKIRVDPQCVEARYLRTLTRNWLILYYVCKKDPQCRARRIELEYPVFRGYINKQQVWQMVKEKFTVSCTLRKKYRKIG